MSSNSYPPTIIVRDKRENQRKCSIMPLRDRPDLVFLTYPLTLSPLIEEKGTGVKQLSNKAHELKNYVRLAADGPELCPADCSSGLLLLDGSWRRAGLMTQSYLHVPSRALHGFRTAYPRVSKKGTDPANGLASVEALFLAYHILGRSTEGLLDHYRWAQEFLRLNSISF
jgi:pre-rRNA-processing protein TSR3